MDRKLCAFDIAAGGIQLADVQLADIITYAGCRHHDAVIETAFLCRQDDTEGREAIRGKTGLYQVTVLYGYRTGYQTYILDPAAVFFYMKDLQVSRIGSF